MAGLPIVSRCEVTSCFYNQNADCHAPAINVGGGHPACDTFINDSRHISRADKAMVGACHVVDCTHNSERTCAASSITVGGHAGHADCTTFDRR